MNIFPDLKSPKETKEVKEDIKVEEIKETEKKSGTNLLDEWFVEGKASDPNDFDINFDQKRPIFWASSLKSAAPIVV